jgi:hypothetical protein
MANRAIITWVEVEYTATPSSAANVTGAQTLSATTQTATANARIAVTGAQTLQAPTQSATAKTIASVTGAQTTQATTQSATANAVGKVTGAQTTSAATQSATATAKIAVTGAQATSTTTQTSSISLDAPARVVTGAQTLSAPTQSATASIRSTITGAQATLATTQSASVSTAPTTSHVFVNVAGVWKPATTWVNHAGTWKRPAHIFVNDAGVWKEVGGTTIVGPIMDSLVIWLDASQATAADPWPNLGSGPQPIMVGAPAPVLTPNALNGKSVIRCATAAGRYRFSGTGVTYNYTLFYVARMWGPTRERVVTTAYPEGGNILYGFWSGKQDVAYAGAFFSPNTEAPATTDWKLYSADSTPSSPSSGRLFSNGVLLGQHPAVTEGFGGYFNVSGYSLTGAAETSDCDIAEVLQYNRQLTDAERIQVESYLRTKWGLT